MSPRRRSSPAPTASQSTAASFPLHSPRSPPAALWRSRSATASKRPWKRCSPLRASKRSDSQPIYKAFPALLQPAVPESTQIRTESNEAQAGRHKITSHAEVIPIQKVNEAFERLLRQDVKYRFAIDMSSLK